MSKENKRFHFKSTEAVREEVADLVKKGIIVPLQIAYETGVSQATVYNFINGKGSNSKIIDWYLGREEN